MNSENPIIRIRDLRKVYRVGEVDVHALRGVDLDVARGEFLSILGPSGCGKSTMLLLAAGLLTPSQGRVLVGEQPIAGPRRETALILQDFGLLPWKTVEHNAALGLKVRGVARAQTKRLTAEALERVGLAEFARSYPAELSGGMRQRLALARAVALDADLLLMDEPLSALDALKREDLQDVLLELWRRRGHTQVLVTHSVEEAAFLGRRVVVVSPRPGRVSAIVDNPGMGGEGYRASEAFYRVATELRRLLALEGAVHAAAGGAGPTELPVQGGGVR